MRRSPYPFITAGMMASKSLPITQTQFRVRSIGESVYDNIEEEVEQEREEMTQKDDEGTSSREKEMQIVCYSKPPEPFTLPNDWFVEKIPRPSKPTHVDKYYYEPDTGKKFRSLLAVQRHLSSGTRDHHPTQRMISENENTTYSDPGTGQQRFHPMRNIERYVTYTGTPKAVVKASTGNQSPCGLRSRQRSVRKRSSITKKDKDSVTLEPPKHCVQPEHHKPYSMKKITLGKDNTAPLHNLSRPPPEKVTWVLSNPGSFWGPYVDDFIVSESEKLNWTEAFMLTMHRIIN